MTNNETILTEYQVEENTAKIEVIYERMLSGTYRTRIVDDGVQISELGGNIRNANKRHRDATGRTIKELPMREALALVRSGERVMGGRIHGHTASSTHRRFQ